MRLLNVDTRRLETFVASPPKYAILSHTWEDEEVLYEDICRPRHELELMKGYKKIDYSCIQAARDGLQYVWIDTCCIDKRSSAELSEAINSMFDWYASSEVCYAYLSDFKRLEDLEKDLRQLRACRWFTRGWTLQELIAPRQVQFFDLSWTYVGERGDSPHTEDRRQPTRNLSQHLSSITRIPQSVLNYGRLPIPRQIRSLMDTFSISQRMNWAASRSTSRLEDKAYCLMGLFSVHMPLLYGEGDVKVFGRLQDEILRVSSDQSIFAINGPLLFAITARDFVHNDQSVELIQLPPAWHPDGHPHESYMESHANMTTTDMFICPLQKCQDCTEEEDMSPIVPTDLHLGILNCALQSDLRQRPAIVLEKRRGEEQVYRKAECLEPGLSEMGATQPLSIATMRYDLCEARMERISIAHGPVCIQTTAFQASRILSLQIHFPGTCNPLYYWPQQPNGIHSGQGFLHVHRPESHYRAEEIGVFGAVMIEPPDGQIELILWGTKPATMPSEGQPWERALCQRLTLSAELQAFWRLCLAWTEYRHTLDDAIARHVMANITCLSFTSWQKHDQPKPCITWIENKVILGHLYCDLYIGDSYAGQYDPDNLKQLGSSEVRMIESGDS